MNSQNTSVTSLQDKKIAVFGLGGVGGYLASLLAKTYPHVSVVVREGRIQNLTENGLRLHSEYKGEIASRPEYVVDSTAFSETQDYIFLCVKNYSLEEACRAILPAIGDNTVIVPVMNGADTADRVRRFLGKGRVIDAVIYIVAFLNGDGSVTQQGQFANLRIGSSVPAQENAVAELSALLKNAEIDHLVSDYIAGDIWRKYILNCAYNVATSYYDNTIGELRSDPVKAKEYEDLILEAYAVALKKNIALPKSEIDNIIYEFYHNLKADATSSLQRDFNAERRTELEIFSGYIVREAARLGLSVPVTERMYQGLAAREAAFGEN